MVSDVLFSRKSYFTTCTHDLQKIENRSSKIVAGNIFKKLTHVSINSKIYSTYLDSS